MMQAAAPFLANVPTLETKRLVLRAPVAADWPHWRDFALTTRAQYIGGPYTEAAAWRGFGNMIGMWILRGFGSFIFHEKGADQPLGSVGPYQQIDWPERELGWTVWNAAVEGKGFAYEAAAAARDYAFASLGWTTAVSYIDHGNDRSVSLAKRLGAVEDLAAATPGGKACHVYRHPAQGAVQ